MNSYFKNKSMEEVYNSILDLLDKYEVSAEDGAVLSANLLFNSLSFLGDTKEELIDSLLNIEKALSQSLDSDTELSKVLPQASVFRPSSKSYSVIGLDRIWGLDPALIDEEH